MLKTRVWEVEQFAKDKSYNGTKFRTMRKKEETKGASVSKNFKNVHIIILSVEFLRHSCLKCYYSRFVAFVSLCLIVA